VNLNAWLANLAGYSQPGDGSSLLSGKQRPTEQQLKKIEDALGVPAVDFEMRAPTAVVSLESLGTRYRSLAAGHIVSVASADGFKEAHEGTLFDQMVDLVRRGVEVRYYFPEDAEASIQDYVTVKRDFDRKVTAEEFARVSAFQVESSAARLFGWRTRFVIFVRCLENGGHFVEHVFLYSRAGATALEKDADLSLGEERREIWIRLERKNGKEYYQELTNHSIPFVRERIENRLASKLQHQYRFSFGHDRDAETYRRLRDFIDTSSVVTASIEDLATQTWGRMLRNSREPEARILEVGPGDGQVTSTALQRLSSLFAQQRFDLTAVEPPSTSRSDQHMCLDDSRCRRVGEPFENYDSAGLRFDLILSVHSLYLIDPSYLLRLVELLRTDGAAIVVMAPLENNFLSRTTLTIDQHLITRRPTEFSLSSYSGKIVDEDPLRNYAEDLEAAFGTYLAGKFHRQDIEENIPVSEIFEDDGGLTQLGRGVIDLFSHGLLDEPVEVEERLWQVALEMRQGAVLPCNNRRYTLVRNEIIQALRELVSGGIS